MINEKDIIKEVFERIDQIIKESVSSKPVRLLESNFLKKYIRLKQEYDI